MNKIRIILTILFGFGLFVSCNFQKNTKCENEFLTISVDLSKNKSIHDIEFIDSIDIIALDNKFLLNKVDKIIHHNDKYYILDIYANSAIYEFDANGKNLAIISDKGRGPGQYLLPTDIFFKGKSDDLCIVSPLDRKIFIYNDNLQTSKIDLPLGFWKMIDSDNGYLGYMNNIITDNPFNLICIDSCMNIVNNLFSINKSFDSKSWSSVKIFSKYESVIHYLDPIDLTVFKIGNTESSKIYQYDFGENCNLKLNKEYDEYMLISEDPNMIDKINTFQETQRFCVAQINYKHQTLLCIYDKQNKRNEVVSLAPYTDKYFTSFGRIIGIDENAIYSLVDAQSMRESINGGDEFNDFESNYPEQIKNLRAKFKSRTINEDDNPFLIVHYIKKYS